MIDVSASVKEHINHSFDENGYFLLPGLIEPRPMAAAISELESWVDRLARELLERGEITDLCEGESFERRPVCLHRQCSNPTSVGRLIRQELHWPGMFGLFFHPILLDIVESVLGPDIRLYPNYSVRPKLPQHAPTRVLWHQDAGYTESMAGGSTGTADLSLDELRMVNVWAPLVPASVANGCMKFIPGSHKLGVVPHEKQEYYLEIAESVLEPLLEEAIDIECDPGDVVIFSNLLFHMGQDNLSDTVRWSADWRYQDASQPTLRAQKGHLARSESNPDQVVRSAEQWSELTFE